MHDNIVLRISQRKHLFLGDQINDRTVYYVSALTPEAKPEGQTIYLVRGVETWAIIIFNFILCHMFRLFFFSM